MKIEIKYQSNTYLIIVTSHRKNWKLLYKLKTRICKIGTSDNNASTQIGSMYDYMKINSPYTYCGWLWIDTNCQL